MGEDTEIAKKLYLEGRAAYDSGDFGIALEKYQTAYDYDPQPGFLFNISQIYRQTGDKDRQVSMLKRYMAEEPKTEYQQQALETILPVAKRTIANYEADSEANNRLAREPRSVRKFAADAFQRAKDALASGDKETAKALFAMANRISPHPQTQRAMDFLSTPQPTEAPQPAPVAPEPGPTPQEQMMRAGTPQSQQAAQAFMSQPEPENWWDYAGQPGPVQPMPDDYQAVMGEIDRPAAPGMPADYQAVLAQLDPARRGGF